MRREKTNLQNEIYVVGIGASAGGLEALIDFLSHLPPGLTETAFIIAQHLSPTYKSMLVQLLSRETNLRVTEAETGTIPQTNHIYITPPDREISIEAGRIKLTKAMAAALPKPSVDQFFNSLARQYRERSVGIILSGTGSDGAEGIRALKAAGGLTIAQEPQTAKYNGMPLAAIETGDVDLVLSPDRIGEQLLEFSKEIASTGLLLQDSSEGSEPLNEVFRLLSRKSGTDFSSYKPSTICRRLEKRLSMLKFKDLGSYLESIEKDPEELDALFNTLLIGVTNFYRDQDAFDALQNHLTKIISSKKQDDVIRVWCPGCASGEEAYSIAMLLFKLVKNNALKLDIQILATDIDGRAIQNARRGVYAKSAVDKLPPDFIQDFFIKNDGEFELTKAIKSLVLFSKHDITANPPFLKLDLISCRNLMIYFGADLQQRLIPLFHYALNPSGILFLGLSETVGTFTDLFVAVDAKNKLFQRKNGNKMYDIRFSGHKVQKYQIPPKAPERAKSAPSLSDMIKETLFNTFEHPYAVINNRMEVLEIGGDIRLYLGLNAGSINTNIVKLAHKNLQIELRSMLTVAFKDRIILKSSIRKIDIQDHSHFVRIIVKPVIYSGSQNELYLVIFENQELDEKLHPSLLVSHPGGEDPRIADLEHELLATKNQMQLYIEEIETSNEELQSLNEELQSLNEELQSSNEELETANEELQSTNEEIQITYTELKRSNDLLEKKEVLLIESGANLKALLNNSLQSFVLIDRAYKIISYNNLAKKTLEKLFQSSVNPGQSIIDFTMPANLEAFINDFNEAMRGKTISNETCIQDKAGNKSWYLYNYTPVQDEMGNTQVISLGILDITTEKALESDLQLREHFINSVLQTVHIGIFVANHSGILINVNDACCLIYGYSREELLGKPITLLLPENALESETIASRGEASTPSQWFREIRAFRKNGEVIDIGTSCSTLAQVNGETIIIATCKDISGRKDIESKLNVQFKELEKTNSELDRFVYSASHDLRAPLTSVMGLINVARMETRSEKQKQYLQMMEKCMLKLDDFVKDIINYSRNTRVEVEKQKIVFSDMLTDTIEKLKFLPNAGKVKYKITVDESVYFYSDRNRLNTIFDNIISNSIKYQNLGREQSFIAIDIKTDSRFAYITIEDNGHGIEEKHLPKIFDMFYRAATHLSGSGLGLFIVKETMNKLQGSIEVSSKYKEGCVFSIQIPNYTQETSAAS